MPDDEQILKQLEKETAGLLFMSESDYPFEIVQWDGPAEITPEFIRTVTNESEDCQVQELEVEEFLSAEQYKKIVDVFTTKLSQSKAYKVGRINMPVYMVGRSESGKWLGVVTRVVQT
jgi:hypothetical protein